MAQRRLKYLYDTDKIKRGKVFYNEPYYYYMEKKPKQIEHLLGLNWVYVWLKKGLKSWEEIHSFEYEVDFGVLRCDAFVAIKNTVTGTFRFIFVEMDIADSDNRFTKIEQYNSLYANDLCEDCWWYGLAESFPRVLLVTTSARKERAIQGQIEGQELVYEVRLLEDIRRECLC